MKLEFRLAWQFLAQRRWKFLRSHIENSNAKFTM